MRVFFPGEREDVVYVFVCTLVLLSKSLVCCTGGKLSKERLGLFVSFCTEIEIDYIIDFTGSDARLDSGCNVQIEVCAD